MTSRENGPFEWFLYLPRPRSCPQNMALNGFVPQSQPIICVGSHEGGRPPKTFLQIARPARMHKSERNPLIMSSQLQHITAQPGTLMHLQCNSMVSVLLLMPNTRYSSSAKPMCHLPSESGVWAQGAGVKTVGLWRWWAKVREEKHAELRFMSLPAPWFRAPLV